MKVQAKRHRVLVRFGFLAFFFLAAAGAQAQKPDHSPQAGQKPDAITVFQDTLKRDGFDVKMGYSEHLNLSELYCEGEIPIALYQNKDAPYLCSIVPELEGESPRFNIRVFRMRPDEAVVLIGLTPPPAKYFSYQPYLFVKDYPEGPDIVFTSMGDTINLHTIKTNGSTLFNTPVVLIYTPDQGIDARVRAAVRKAGFPSSIINTLVFPSSLITLGLDKNADQFILASRNAVWENEGAGQEYLNNPPSFVFRVTPREPAALQPFPAPPLRVRGTGQTEMDWADKLAELREGIIAAQPEMDAVEYTTQTFAYEGFDFIQRKANALGDSRDALYLMAGYMPDYGLVDEMTLAEDEYLIVYGLNHVATGKATYTNINVYASETAKLGLGSIYDHDLQGTAVPYLQPGDPAADQMYVCKISRDCAGGNGCLQVSAGDCDRLTLDSETLLGVTIRLYLEPSTKVGPAIPEIIYDRVIKFSPKD